MTKCVYCKRRIKSNEVKFASLVYPGERVCSACARKEDSLWLTLNKGVNFPDFTDELQLEKFFDEARENENQ